MVKMFLNQSLTKMQVDPEKALEEKHQSALKKFGLEFQLTKVKN